MKEYCVVNTKKYVPVAVLHIVTYQYEDYTDEIFEQIINEFIEKSGGNCKVKVLHKDFTITFNKNNERVHAMPTDVGFDIVLEKYQTNYTVEDCSKVISFKD